MFADDDQENFTQTDHSTNEFHFIQQIPLDLRVDHMCKE